jgi:hypothetical protein
MNYICILVYDRENTDRVTNDKAKEWNIEPKSVFVSNLNKLDLLKH